ncbi:hypothetical protein EDD18DRAFT_1322729 [Armillaria luteobubalina]|uniref:CxC2-like cysteine cluster KDZ transposase-associated domain-containing protein n=1 Tax=Armillaria luteobubalina TaxID=153913 RepID=A0AA39TBH4_9AGAR|nr:hypothetical protein EDD18DRAFT_1322729 [Armillaria luteobubalina]
MAVLRNPKPKVKRCRVRWNSHSIELYADTTDIAPAHRRHHHHSWSFAGSSTISSVKHGFVHLPVSPQKRKSMAAENITDLPELIPGSDNVDDENGFAPHAEYHLDPEAYALAMAGDVEDIATAPRRRIYMYNPLLTFSSHVDGYVAESLRREGHGDAMSQNRCSAIGCEDKDFPFRCTCIVSLHEAYPTHVIQSWNGNYFDKVPLRQLGMRYQVGHLAGEACPHPQPAFGNHFTIIDTNGIHDVALDFCSCMRKHPFAMQLQGSWLFPATDIELCTTVTTVALEQFQMLTFMGKISAYEYYHSLVRLTDNTGIKSPSDNFNAFIRVVREWSFIRLLKRAGVGNDPGGWKDAKPGSCAVECLACPRPGVNILEQIDPDSPTAWENTLYVGMDANFHLERFNVSSEEKVPGLSKGLAYFPPSSCSNHEAAKGDKRSSVRTRDLAASGVGGVVCTRHELKLPLCTVDLRVGETQVEMDYGYLTAIKRFAGVPRLVTSYDIACQWSINLEEWIDIYGDFMCLKIPKKVYLVPKFHLPSHIKDCQEKYCMSFHIHVGENDGEAPERSWAISNGVAASTREMGPGHQWEKLDQHFGDFNWQKNVLQGDTLLCKIKDAVPKASDHEDRFERFMASLPQGDVAKWTTMVEAWEMDRNKPNPFAQTVASKTEAAMRLQLAREDAQDEIAGLDGDTLHTTSPKSMISQGIQLESSQRRVSRLMKELGAHSTDLQRAQVLEKSNRLRCTVESWFVVQEVHMPTVQTLRIRDNRGDGPSLPAYSLPLYLPSSTLTRAESRLRIAQGQLLSLSKAYKDGDTNVLTQKERLKCHKTTRDLNARITQAKQYYRDVRKRLTILSTELGEWSWQAQLRILEDSDVRRIADDEVGISEGNRMMSWIWYSSHLGDVPGGVEECLRIEWCKTRARAHRWCEECQLLRVEMDRIKRTLEHEANLWLSRAKSAAEGVALINAGEGAGAYTKRQAMIRTSLRLSFEDKWRFVGQWLELGETSEALPDDEDF